MPQNPQAPNPAAASALAALKRNVDTRNELLGQPPQPMQPPMTEPPPSEGRLELSPQERALFSKQTGVKFNPYAGDIELHPGPDAEGMMDLLRRIEAITGKQ